MKTEENNPLVEDDKEFDVFKFCRRHLRVSSWHNERNQVYTAKELRDLLNLVVPIFKEEPTLATLSPPCTIVGDIHGQYRDLIRILNFTNDRELMKNAGRKLGVFTKRFMFLGDYVDRGAQSIECICLLFSLKVIYRDQYKLLRGNHETKEVNFAYGFREELIDKLGDKQGIQIWKLFNIAFQWMPLAGLVGNKILCMHGGISSYLKSLDDIRNIQRPVVDVEKAGLECDLLWADPFRAGVPDDAGKAEFVKNGLRGCGTAFNQGAVKECLKKLNINLIVRAHQVQQTGYSFYADRKLVTIFSASRYNAGENMGSVLRVKVNGGIAITTFSAREKNETTETKEEQTTNKTEKKKKKEKIAME